MIDSDPKGDLSRNLISIKDLKKGGLFEAFYNEDFELLKIKENLYLLYGDIKLDILEKSFINELDAFYNFKYLLDSSKFNPFDFIFIDTSSSLGVLTINAFTVSNFLIIPITQKTFSIQNLNYIIELSTRINISLNSKLMIFGGVLNKYCDNGQNESRNMQEIKGFFGERLFNTSLSYNKYLLNNKNKNRKNIIEIKKYENRMKNEIKLIGIEFIKRLEKIYY
jgi:chromosome partitioning protein